MKLRKISCLAIMLLILQSKAFAQYNVGNGCGFAYSCAGELPLPIELLYFKAECMQSNVNFKWATASETNNNFFSLERSFDGVYFESFGVVAGAGNSSHTIHYSDTYKNAFNGISYYRLKQTDFDGTYEYSNIIAVNCNDKTNREIKIYPNPAQDMISVNVDCPLKNAEFFLISTTGVEFELKTNVNAHTQDAFTIDVSGFSPGIYLFVIINNNKEKVFTEKLIIK